MRYLPFLSVLAGFGLSLALVGATPWAWAGVALFGVASLFGLADYFQVQHAIRRNYPVTGRMRWFFYWLRPFLRQYIVESETEGRPFNHEQRTLVYRRAKDVSSVEPFGSHVDAGPEGYEWLSHSLAAKTPKPDSLRVQVGGRHCAKPHTASILNISAMSFGSLGAKAIEALNKGAAAGGFYHDTGEGAVSRHHRHGGDLVWELGSGYFGCRAPDGSFDPQRFKDVAADDQIKMIEVKLSQGAKPGHGGVLPGAKVSQEIAEARGIPIGETCISPPYHPAFSTPLEMMAFVAQLRDLSNGKPIGLKLCMGPPREFLALVKAMLDTGIAPDFIVVDGAEGGTGAAPVEFQDHIGAPLRDGLILARNALVGAGLKDDVALAASGKLISGFGMAASMALGADWVNSGRGFMFALGCVQSLQCHTNHCPTGVATQDIGRQRALVVTDKAARVRNFHHNTVHALAEVCAAAGVEHPRDLTPDRLMIRMSPTEAKPATDVYNILDPGALLSAPARTPLGEAWADADPSRFG
ncbi:MAG: FMN-binding glutamate synthase family protein [Pseudomonadota bacterium]